MITIVARRAITAKSTMLSKVAVSSSPTELAPVSLDTTLSARTEKEWPS